MTTIAGRWVRALAVAAVTLAVTGGNLATASAAVAPAAAGRCASRALSGGAALSGGVLSAAAAAPKVTVWMAGDSTMANATTCPIGWGSQFDPYFNGDVNVVNNAVAGRSIQTWLYDPNVTSTKNSAGECVISPATYSSRWQTMLNSTTGMKAGDYLFIQFGINDGDSACPRHVGSARFKQLLGLMTQAALDRGAHPVLVTPVAAITCSGSTAVGNRGFVTETTSVAASYGVPVIDLHKLSVALYNSLKLCPNNGNYTQGAVGAFFCNDHTHFELAGAVQIAGVVATAIRNQKIPLGTYLLSNPLPSTSPTPTPPATTPPVTPPASTPPTPTRTPTPTGAVRTCRATYRAVNTWAGGFQGEVTVLNSGTVPLTGWSVRMTFPGGQTVSQAWNGTAATSGGVVTVTNLSWNGSLAPSASATFGFTATGTAAVPTVSCGV